jgi:hypothetical protein
MSGTGAGLHSRAAAGPAETAASLLLLLLLLLVVVQGAACEAKMQMSKRDLKQTLRQKEPEPDSSNPNDSCQRDDQAQKRQITVRVQGVHHKPKAGGVTPQFRKHPPPCSF